MKKLYKFQKQIETFIYQYVLKDLAKFDSKTNKVIVHFLVKINEDTAYVSTNFSIEFILQTDHGMEILLNELKRCVKVFLLNKKKKKEFNLANTNFTYRVGYRYVGKSYFAIRKSSNLERIND